MKIENLYISGFKAINELEMNPNNINIITGRNNTGKTSLLQSIDLLFSPNNINDYNENIDKLINEGSENACIKARFSPRQQSLTEYGDSDENWHRELEIHRPAEERLPELFLDVLQDVLDINERYPPGFHLPTDRQVEDLEHIQNLLRDSLHEAISNLSQNTIKSNVEDNCVILKIQEEEYPYVYLGDYYTDIRRRIVSDAMDEFRSEFSTFELNENEEDISLFLDSIQRSFGRFLAPRFGRGRFVYEEPTDMDNVKFVEPNVSESQDFDLDKKESAVRVSNIEDYLKSNDIVTNLADFSFDKIVFKQEDGKYEIPYEFMGDGFKILIHLLWAMFDSEDTSSVLLIEEAESHMHPGYIDKFAQRLLKISKKHGLQVFVTTHNDDFIEAFFSESLEQGDQAYLTHEFKLLQLTEPFPKPHNYKQAEEKIKELHLDLRGI